MSPDLATRKPRLNQRRAAKCKSASVEKKIPKEKREKFKSERVSGMGEKSRNRPKRASGYSSRSLPRTFGERFIIPRERKREHQDLHSLMFSAAFTLWSQDRNFSGSILPKFRRLFFRFLAHSRPKRIPSTYSKMASFHLRGARRIPVPHYAGPDSLSLRDVRNFFVEGNRISERQIITEVLSVLIFDEVIGQE